VEGGEAWGIKETGCGGWWIDKKGRICDILHHHPLKMTCAFKHAYLEAPALIQCDIMIDL